MKLIKKIFIDGKIELKTGLHIGGSSTALDIGGIDSNVIKNANGVPFIPGSSIKGKIRSLMEMKYSEYTEWTGLVDNGKVDRNQIIRKCNEYDKSKDKYFFSKKLFKEYFDELFFQKNQKIDYNHSKDDLIKQLCECLNQSTEIQKLFGSVAKESTHKTRTIFRDAFLSEETLSQMGENKSGEFAELELDYTEGKWENTIDRLTSAANPRQLERIPAGAKFDFSIVFTYYEETDSKLMKMLLEGMNLLQDDYLGGSGSRGYGQIEFKEISITEKTAENYKELSVGSKKIGSTDLTEINIEKL